MNGKNKEVSYDFCEDYKILSFEERVEVNKMARALFEFQKEHSVFVADGEEAVLGNREGGE